MVPTFKSIKASTLGKLCPAKSTIALSKIRAHQDENAPAAGSAPVFAAGAATPLLPASLAAVGNASASVASGKASAIVRGRLPAETPAATAEPPEPAEPPTTAESPATRETAAGGGPGGGGGGGDT